MENLTDVRENPFSDLEESNLADTESADEFVLPIFHIAMLLLKFITHMASIGASILLLYVMFKFKRLQMTTNNYMTHYVIVNLVFVLFVASISFLHLSSFTVCILSEIEHISIFLCLTFATAMALEWYVVNFRKELHGKFAFLKTYSIALLYLVGLIKFLLYSCLCYHDYRYFSSMIMQGTYFIFLIIIILVNYVKCNVKLTQDQAQMNYLVVVATFVICSWLPIFIYHCIFQYFYHVSGVFKILLYTYWLPMFLAYCGPIVVVYLLGRLNKHFKMAYDSLFKCSVKNYANENIDEASINDHIPSNHNSSVQVPLLNVNGNVDQTCVALH